MIEYKSIRDYDYEEDKIPETPKTIEKTAAVKVNVRATGSLQGKIVRVLEAGAKITVYPTDEEWSKTIDGNYIMTKFLK